MAKIIVMSPRALQPEEPAFDLIELTQKEFDVVADAIIGYPESSATPENITGASWYTPPAHIQDLITSSSQLYTSLVFEIAMHPMTVHFSPIEVAMILDALRMAAKENPEVISLLCKLDI